MIEAIVDRFIRIRNWLWPTRIPTVRQALLLSDTNALVIGSAGAGPDNSNEDAIARTVASMQLFLQQSFAADEENRLRSLRLADGAVFIDPVAGSVLLVTAGSDTPGSSALRAQIDEFIHQIRATETVHLEGISVEGTIKPDDRTRYDQLLERFIDRVNA